MKRQAASDLLKSHAASESETGELVTVERMRMERLICEVRRQAAEEAVITMSKQEDSSESCWNCGRKAAETCSGCNVARYCGSFCQHKDWENHHRVCGQGTGTGLSAASTSSNHTASASDSANSSPASAAAPSSVSVASVVAAAAAAVVASAAEHRREPPTHHRLRGSPSPPGSRHPVRISVNDKN